MTQDRYFLMTVILVAVVAVLTIYSYYQKTVEDEYYASLKAQVESNRNVGEVVGNVDTGLLERLGDELSAALDNFTGK